MGKALFIRFMSLQFNVRQKNLLDRFGVCLYDAIVEPYLKLHNAVFN